MVGLDCCAMEAMDGSMADTDGTDRGAKETDNYDGRVDRDSIADEDDPHSRVSLNCTRSTEVAVPDKCVHDRRNIVRDADGVSPQDSAALADNRCMGPDVHDIKDARVDCHASESDDDCSGETTSLEACMTPSGQDYYLRWGGTPRRRSALRLSRIIARQQLLQRLSQGRDSDYCEIFVKKKSRSCNFRRSVCVCPNGLDSNNQL